MDSYELDIPRLQRTLRAIEGVWENGKHIKGRIVFDMSSGNSVYHLKLGGK